MEHDMSSKILSTVWIGDTEKDAQEFQWLLATLGEARMQTGIQCEVIPVQPSETGNFVIAQLMRGMAQTRGDLLFFVDAHVLPSASCVTQLLHALTAERAGGVAAPAAFRSAFSAPRRMPRYHDFGSLWAFCRELEAVGDSPEPAIVLDSGCFLLGRAVFEEAGGLDARFLTMHYALADLSLRLLQAGYHVTVVAPQVFRSTPELDQLRAELRPLLGDGVGVENLDAYQWVVVGEKR